MIRLTDEEIKKRWLEGYEEQNLTSDEFILDNLSNNLYYEDMVALKAVAEAQLKKVHDWGNEPCPHSMPIPAIGNIPSATIRKRVCDKCWKALLEEVK